MPDDTKSEFKYLAIKNWAKYQKLFRGKPARYIFDYTDQDSDYDFSKLTMFERGVYAGCRRLRGRFGHNLHNDATWVARALNTLPTDRARISNAMRTLIERGLLILSNQKEEGAKPALQDETKQDNTKTERTVQLSSGQPSLPSASASQETPETPTPDLPAEPSVYGEDVERLAVHFRSKTEYVLNEREKGMLKELLKQNAKHPNPEERVRNLVDFALEQSWYADKIQTFAFLYDKMDKIVPAYNAVLRGKKRVQNAGTDGRAEYQKDAGKFFARAKEKQNAGA